MSSAEYNQLLKFLYFEGYADSYEEAENLIEEMSDEEFEEIFEGFKEANLEKMKRQEYRHTKRAVSQSGGSRGSSKNRASKMSSIRGAIERGEDPRADGYGGARAARGNPPEDHRAAFSKNPLNNPPRPVKKAGVQREEFESVVEYLFVEGYADTIENAEIMAECISEDWVNDIVEARASEIRGMGSPERPLSFRGQNIERGAKGGRRWMSGGQGGSRIERGLRNVPKSPTKVEPNEPQSQVQRLRGTEQTGKYAKMQAKRRGSEMGSPRD